MVDQNRGLKDITIVVATHKQYWMPEDKMYLPLHVGAAGNDLNFGYEQDNTGENISARNPFFCELTGLYWAWKNLDADHIGLAHYRRHFSFRYTKTPTSAVLTHEEIRPYLGKKKIFVPKKRRYFIDTLYGHYKHTHYIEQLDVTREIIRDMAPEYLEEFDPVVKRTSGYMFNMMIMRKDYLDQYCSWLFPILFELEERMKDNETMQSLTPFQSRFYGRVSEIIFNVWLERQLKTGNIRKSELMEIPVIQMDPVDWRKKGLAFLKARFSGKKYEESF